MTSLIMKNAFGQFPVMTRPIRNILLKNKLLLLLLQLISSLMSILQG